jgi:hypothetical protein
MGDPNFLFTASATLTSPPGRGRAPNPIRPVQDSDTGRTGAWGEERAREEAKAWGEGVAWAEVKAWAGEKEDDKAIAET